LKAHNQKIAVITFTNVAANEVKERLGNSKLVEVSTIHKRLWDLISPYNKQLVAIHLWNLRKELYKENKYIYDNKEFGHLTKEAQNDFIKVMKEYKNDFYAFYNDKAAIARENYEKILSSNDIN